MIPGARVILGQRRDFAGADGNAASGESRSPMNMIHQPRPVPEEAVVRPSVQTIAVPPVHPAPGAAPGTATPAGEIPAEAPPAEAPPRRRRLWIPALLLLVAGGGAAG